MSQENHEGASPVTLDSVFKALQYWRSHKNEYSSAGIPDEIWSMIFQLEGEQYSGSELRRLFALSSSQYKIKKSHLCGSSESPSPAPPDKSTNLSQTSKETINFCEALVTSHEEPSIPSLTEKIKENKQAVSKLKSNDTTPAKYLDVTTIIVECIRPDGHRLKIHTTNESLNIVMATFYQQGVIPA